MRLSIIDPPVSAFSKPEEIKVWLDELASMDQQDISVKEAIEDAERWLELAEKN